MQDMINRQRLYLFAGVLVLTAAAWILSYPDYVGICPEYGVNGQYACVDRFILITEPAAALLTAISGVFIIALFIQRSAFRAWKLFSAAYVPVAIVLLAITPAVAPNIVSFDREQASWLLSILYIVLSLILIAYKSWRLKKTRAVL